VRMPMRFLAKPTSQHWHVAIMHSVTFFTRPLPAALLVRGKERLMFR